MAVSIEEGQFYFWINASPLFGTNVSTENEWEHFAVVRYGGSITVYMNGVPIAEPIINNGNMVDNVHNLVIGNESVPTEEASFSGYITNFRIIKGTAHYRTTFTPPSESLTVIPGTVLLLRADDPNNLTRDATGKTVVNTRVSWDSIIPFF
jgi:hypothetical protein